MKTLVTGGTGFLASHLIPALQRRGHQVSAFILPSSDPAGLRQRGVEVHVGDVRRLDTLTPTMRGTDAVFHLAAAIGVRRPMRDYHAVNVTGTENVCRAALAAGVKRLVHVSSTSVYQQGLGLPLREDFPLKPLPDPYPRTKAAGDNLVQRLIESEHLPATIVRTSTIFGPGDDLNFGRIADRLLAGKSIVIGSGRNRVPFAFVGDVVQGLLLVLEHERAEGQIYNLADGGPPTQEELLHAVAGELGARMPRVHVPYGLAYGTAFAAEGAARLTRTPHPLVTRFGIALYGADNRVAIDKARQELGYQPRVSLPQGVSIAADWYRGRPATPGSTGHGASLTGARQ
jgi:nucleoside-diphosphate-sugar epimerase